MEHKAVPANRRLVVKQKRRPVGSRAAGYPVRRKHGPVSLDSVRRMIETRVYNDDPQDFEQED